MIKSAIKVLSALFIIVTISSSYAEEGVITMAVSQTIYHSGILNYFIPLFEKRMPYRMKILPLSNEEAINVGRSGKADILFMNAAEPAEKFIADGFGLKKWEIMHNFSVILGPEGDPASIKGKDPVEALKAIAKGKFLFVSGLDCPDIQMTENRLWRDAGIVPEGVWYIKGAGDMREVIDAADFRSAYVLSERGSYLSSRGRIKLALLVDRHPLLFNQYVLIEINPGKFPGVNISGARAFASFVTSNDGEDIIRRFGTDKYGEPLFYPQ